MLIIKNKGQPATLNQLARAIQPTGIVPPHKQNRIRVELRYLQEGPERFGAVDIHNAQQVALAAYRIVRGGIPRPGRGRQPPVRAPDVYTLAIIGSGSTAAYYIDTLGPAHDHPRTVVIGEHNPWIHKRGRKPPEAEENSTVQNRARIIEMDTFIRDKAVQEKGRGQSVVVWGSNAAIDAVAAAKKVEAGASLPRLAERIRDLPGVRAGRRELRGGPG